NTSNLGGGMSNLDSSAAVTDCTFQGNVAYTYGGGMYNGVDSVNTVTAPPSFTSCTFNSNRATSMGGGMYNESIKPKVTDCLFTKNEGANGGGMGNSYSSPTILNCTFTQNSAIDQAGVGGGMYSYNSSPVLTNCIVWGNTWGNAGKGADVPA